MFFEDHIDDAKYCGHLYGLGSASAYVQNGTGNAYEEEANKQQSWRRSPSSGNQLRKRWTSRNDTQHHSASCSAHFEHDGLEESQPPAPELTVRAEAFIPTDHVLGSVPFNMLEKMGF